MIRLLVFLLFMVCGTGLFYLVFVHELPKAEEEASLPQPTTDLTLRNIHVKQNRGMELEWEAFADSATYNESTRQAWMTTVRFEMFQEAEEAGQPPSQIHGVADSAFVDDNKKRVLLQGKVRIVKDENTEVSADVVDYYTNDGLVKARGNVQVKDRRSFVQGDTLTYNINTERVVVGTPKLFQ